MANYVTNYVFCNEDLFNDFFNVEYNQRLFREGMYDPVGCVLNKERRLVIFDTRGMEYKREEIGKIISQYHDVIWNCVEENQIEEGQFYWNGENVDLKLRALQTSDNDSIFTFEFFNSTYKTFKEIIGFPNRIVEENYVINKKREFYLSEHSSNQLITYISKLRSWLLEQNILGELPSKKNGEILEEYWFWGSDASLEQTGICACDADAATQEEFAQGELLKKDIKEYFKSFFDANGVKVQLSYKRMEEFVGK